MNINVKSVIIDLMCFSLLEDRTKISTARGVESLSQKDFFLRSELESDRALLAARPDVVHRDHLRELLDKSSLLFSRKK